MRHPAFRARSRLFPLILSSLGRFLQIEAASGILLIAAAAAAMAWANSPGAAFYEALRHAQVPLEWVGLGAYSMHFLINEGLMTIFFLVVGLELRREMREGALATRRSAALPVIAAAGGVAVPAIVYIALNTSAGSLEGWAVPVATDIAFAVGVLSLLGRRVPAELRVLLLALAVIDDIAAILIIAFFFARGIEPVGLAIAAAAIIAILSINGSRWRSPFIYLALGVVIWIGFIRAGVHPTLAGVVLGLLMPASRPSARKAPQAHSLAGAMEAALHPWVAFAIMPLFALANAGVSIEGIAFDAPAPSIAWGIALGLAFGKPLGVVGAAFIGAKLGLCELPRGLPPRSLWVIGCLAGIGFTMAIFIANLAFDEGPLLATAKLAVLGGSVTAALLGLAAGWILLKAPTNAELHS